MGAVNFLPLFPIILSENLPELLMQSTLLKTFSYENERTVYSIQ